MPAWLVVRAVVADAADRADFDHWYRTAHLPDALRAFHAEAAWRGWSRDDPSVHFACYRFASVAAAEVATSGATIQALVAEFDSRWGTRITRTREIIDVADMLEASS
ncbi:MAG TPA: hypothetical protein VMU81_04220 [Acetobacteraceae bacterium]|nr:hypothetical protein [Acetobacteraceae bacterium]